jgi:hypothetical protein
MSRAAVQLQRKADGDWRPVGVWLGTRTNLQSRFLPGMGLDDFARRVHQHSRPPLVAPDVRGTWEDWIEWALEGLSNGHDLHIVGVEPELTVDELYARDVLGLPRDQWKAHVAKGIPNLSAVPVDELGGPSARA